MNVHIKRIYDDPSPDDGCRILVDRLWPRGISKEQAQLDEWLKGIAPSPELRIWFGHEPERFKEFKVQYEEELRVNPAINELQQIIKKNKTVTLLYGARDPAINHAVVLSGFIQQKN